MATAHILNDQWFSRSFLCLQYTKFFLLLIHKLPHSLLLPVTSCFPRSYFRQLCLAELHRRLLARRSLLPFLYLCLWTWTYLFLCKSPCRHLVGLFLFQIFLLPLSHFSNCPFYQNASPANHVATHFLHTILLHSNVLCHSACTV